jgi:ribosome recycling factor
VNKATNPGLVFESSRWFSRGKGDVKKDKKRDKPKVALSDQELGTVIDVEDFRSSIEAIVAALKESYIKTLNIRAGVGLEDLEVTFDGDKYPLKELATISKKPNNLLVLNLASLPDALKAVLEAVNSSGMNVNPQQEGTKIYIQLPRMTHEHREILAKNAKTLFVKAKEELTKIQNEHVKTANSKKGTGYSDDLIFNATENIRFIGHRAIADCEALCAQKTKELLGDK